MKTKPRSGQPKSKSRPAPRTARRIAVSMVPLRLKERSYSAYIGAGAIRKVATLLKSRPEAASRRAFIIADRFLKAPLASLSNTLEKSGWKVHTVGVTAGEPFKEIDSILPIYAELLRLKADRDSVLFALGGGSIGDAVGFIAATYLRGVAWVGVPTTLLAQVDSAVGGKTGINHPNGKNLIGSFHQPISVICDLDFLRTLSRREIISGLGEIVKYGLIYDAKFLQDIQSNWDEALELNPKVLADLVTRSIEFKARAVERDEFDRKGIREALNYGHTFGHAIEKATGYGSFQHGEAVLWGMRFATILSHVRGCLKETAYQEISHFMAKIELPALPKSIGFSTYLKHMGNDKKLRRGSVHFVLLKKIGRCFSSGQVTEKDLQTTFELLGEIYGQS